MDKVITFNVKVVRADWVVVKGSGKLFVMLETEGKNASTVETEQVEIEVDTGDFEFWEKLAEDNERISLTVGKL